MKGAIPPLTLAVSVAICPKQMSVGGLMETLIGVETCKITWSETALQEPLPVEESVKITVPLASSATLGVYVAVKEVLSGENVPFPPDQMPPVAPVTVPFKVTEVPQVVWSEPAFTTGTGLEVTVTLVTGAGQAG